MPDSSSQFTAVDWADHSDVKVTCQLARCGTHKLLRVCFAGTYGYGSEGDADATYMDAMYRAAVDIFRPDGVLLDFSDLDYDWGVKLGMVLNLPYNWSHEEKPPFALITGPSCDARVRSLLVEDAGMAESDLGWIFQDLTEARQYVEEILRERDIAAKREREEYEAAQSLAFWNLLGPELGPEQCRHSGCHRLRVRDSVLCRVHHYKRFRNEDCPFE